jgi:hypothetical protein
LQQALDIDALKAVVSKMRGRNEKLCGSFTKKES